MAYMHDVEHIIENAKDVMTVRGDIVEDDSEVTYLTPSKVVQPSPWKKMRARKLKSPFLVTTKTREQLKNTLPNPDKFDPNMPIPNDITMKFFEYLEGNEDNLMDYHMCNVDKNFFNVLLKEASWLTDKVKSTFFFFY